MDSATHLPARLRVLGTEYAVEQHKSVVYLVGPRGGQHALIARMGTLRSDAFPGIRFALDLSSASKRGAAVELERVEAPKSASEVALLLRGAIGTAAADCLLAAVMLDSWESLQRAIVALAERDPRVVDVLRSLVAVAS